jgi:hypothetical protein
MEETFYPSKRDWLIVLFGGIGFVVLGGWMMTGGESALFRCMGGFIAALSLMFLPVALVHLLPNNSFLKISPDGMTVRSLWRSTQYRWVDIERFGVAEVKTERGGIRQTHQRVGFNFSKYSPPLRRAVSPDRFNRRVGGFEAALPDTYGKNCAELAAYLNKRRDQFLGQTTERPSVQVLV